MSIDHRLLYNNVSVLARIRLCCTACPPSVWYIGTDIVGSSCCYLCLSSEKVSSPEVVTVDTRDNRISPTLKRNTEGDVLVPHRSYSSYSSDNNAGAGDNGAVISC